MIRASRLRSALTDGPLAAGERAFWTPSSPAFGRPDIENDAPQRLDDIGQFKGDEVLDRLMLVLDKRTLDQRDLVRLARGVRLRPYRGDDRISRASSAPRRRPASSALKTQFLCTEIATLERGIGYGHAPFWFRLVEVEEHPVDPSVPRRAAETARTSISATSRS